jgi:hypothetical protein
MARLFALRAQADRMSASVLMGYHTLDTDDQIAIMPGLG